MTEHRDDAGFQTEFRVKNFQQKAPVKELEQGLFVEFGR
jgi:hypothetical protein